MWKQLTQAIKNGDKRALARTISLVENEAHGYLDFLQQLPAGNALVTGITGPPGAGKSTLVNALLHRLHKENKKVAVLCVDPSSPFHLGALLGDRIRMNEWHDEKNIYIRSLASRGNLGGLHPKIIEISDVLKCFFDVVLIETVGVGQSEIDIAALADITALVLVPEGGDEIQAMKAGIMEIADVFVVNKADRPGADIFLKNLRYMLGNKTIPVIKTVATNDEGIDELAIIFQHKNEAYLNKERRQMLLIEKIYKLVQQQKMKAVSRKLIEEYISNSAEKNLYKIAQAINAQTS